MPDETGIASPNTSRTAGLAEVLARESRRHKIDVPDALKRPDVAHQPNVPVAPLENARCTWIDFAQQNGFVAGLMQPFLDSTDSSEQTCNS